MSLRGYYINTQKTLSQLPHLFLITDKYEKPVLKTDYHLYQTVGVDYLELVPASEGNISADKGKTIKVTQHAA